jgi:tetratricopeptide (TPR) repeat protein
MSGRAIKLTVALLLLTGIAGATALFWPNPADTEDALPADLPIPPFPPRITEGATYEACLAALASDPAGASAIAEAWQSKGGGDGAAHCQGLALIALGKPEDGAALLEQLARRSGAPPLARASVLSQADDARADATAALALSPADTELLIMRASAEGELGALQQAVEDLNQALLLDGTRSDALVSRAVLWRRMGQLDKAQADVALALARDPDDPDALLERGILRQRMGDSAGAQADWEHARGADPNSTTADLAEQNLSLLAVGPRQ